MSRRTLNADRAFSASTWLLAAAEDPTAARSQWDRSGVAILECGRVFGAARVPGDLVELGARSTNRQEIAAHLDEALAGGAVFVDTQSKSYYFLVPPGACLRWNMPGTRCLGTGWSIGVPRPGLPDSDGRARLRWALEMYGPGALCVPGAVMQLVARAQHRKAQAEHVAEASHG